MTREEGFKLLCDLADEGFSAQLSLASHPGYVPSEEAYVTLSGYSHIESVSLNRLAEIGLKFGLHLHLIANALRFLPHATNTRPAERLRPAFEKHHK